MAKKPEDRHQNYKELIDAISIIKKRALKFQQLKNSTLILKVKKDGNKRVLSV